MRINKWVALATGMSRRRADSVIQAGRVTLNQKTAASGDTAEQTDQITLDSRPISIPDTTTLILNKPVGYVCSRAGQGSKTIYDLLPEQYHHLKPVGRLDKDSSGLILLTNDGELANQLTHPRYQKEKIYLVNLNKPLNQPDKQRLLTGVKLEDGLSKFIKTKQYSDQKIEVTLTEGRNRQIRRTFDALGYEVTSLHRTNFGNYRLKDLRSGGLTQVV